MTRVSKKKESPEELKHRSQSVLSKLKKIYPHATTALHYSNPLQILIATILSAQCTDARVNLVTKDLFKKYKNAKDYASVDPKELEQDIHSTGFFRAKAKNIINCCKVLLERYNGKVPDTMDELITLAGVGRKTANVVLSNCFGKTEGIVVDTHVMRLSNRLAFSQETDPGKIEKDLMALLPKKDWISVSDLLMAHGRSVCDARRPNCPECPVSELCPSKNIGMKK